jgi:hypothetical protein
MLYFDKYVLGYILGHFFHKLIWSPWSIATPLSILMNSILSGRNFHFPFEKNGCLKSEKAAVELGWKKGRGGL